MQEKRNRHCYPEQLINSRKQNKKMVRRCAEEEEEGEETKSKENLSQVMRKNKKDQENYSTNQRFDVISVKASVILQMNANMRRNRGFVKRQRI